MSSKSKARKGKMGGLDADSEDAESITVSTTSKAENYKQPRGEASSTSNEPSSASATSTGWTSYQTAQLGLPTLAHAAAAAAPQVQKKSRRAGFREQFLQQLRVMLDRESLNDDTSVRWSEDGSSFIITDQNHFEEHIIPMYFDNAIAFSSFLSKLSRWGFKRVSNRRTGCYEFYLAAFVRLGAASAPAAATSTCNNARGGASMHVQLQQTQASSLLHQVMAQLNQFQTRPPVSAANPLPRQALADANANAIADLISNIQRRGQHPSTPSQQQPVDYLAPSSQQQQQPDPTMNTLNTALHSLIRGQTSSAPLTGSISPSIQNLAMNALMTLSGTSPSTNYATLPGSRFNNTALLQQLVMVMQRVVEEEQQRRAQVDSIQNTIVTAIGQMLGSGGSFVDNNVARSQQGAVPHQVGAPSQSSSSNVSNQVDLIALITEAARRVDLARQSEGEGAHVRGHQSGGGDSNGVDNVVGREVVGGSAFPRKRDSPDDDDLYYDSDEESWDKRLRPRKKSHRK